MARLLLLCSRLGVTFCSSRAPSPSPCCAMELKDGADNPKTLKFLPCKPPPWPVRLPSSTPCRGRHPVGSSLRMSQGGGDAGFPPCLRGIFNSLGSHSAAAGWVCLREAMTREGRIAGSLMGEAAFRELWWERLKPLLHRSLGWVYMQYRKGKGKGNLAHQLWLARHLEA